MARMLKTTVYLTRELKARLERKAAESRQTEADIIRAALEQFTAPAQSKPKLPLFDSGKPVGDWAAAMRGFGED